MTWFGWKNEQVLNSPAKQQHHQMPNKNVTFGSSDRAEDFAVQKQVRKMMESPQSDIQKDMNEFRIAGLFFKSGLYDQSLEHLNIFLESNSNSSAALKLKGEIMEEKKEFNEALSFFIQAYELGLSTPEVISKIKRMIHLVKNSNDKLMQKDLNKYLQFAINHGIEINANQPRPSSIGRNSFNDSISSNYGDIEITVQKYLECNDEEEKIAMFKSLLSISSSANSFSTNMQTQYVHCLADIIMICFFNMHKYHEKIFLIGQTVELFTSTVFSNVDVIDNHYASLYLLIMSLTLIVFENNEVKDASSIAKCLSDISRSMLKISEMLYSSKYDTFSEIIISLFKCLNNEFDKKRTNTVMRVSSKGFDSYYKLLKAIGSTKPEKSMAIKIMQQIIMFDSKNSSLPIQIHNSLSNLPLMHFIANCSEINSTGIDLLSKGLIIKFENDLIPSNPSYQLLTLWDITIFINILKNSQLNNKSKSQLSKLWSEIVKSVFKHSNISDEMKDFLRSLRSFAFDQLRKYFTITNFENLENSLIKEFDAFESSLNPSCPDLAPQLLHLMQESKSNINFHNLVAHLEQAKESVTYNSKNLDKSATTSANNNENEKKEESVTLKLIETFNNFMNIALNKSQNFSATMVKSNNSSIQTTITEQIPDNSSPPLLSSTPTAKLPEKQLLKPKDFSLFKSKCSLKLERAPKQPFNGFITISKNESTLTVQFLTSGDHLTKLKTFVQFENGIPLSPLKLVPLSGHDFKWTIIDFSSGSDGSIQTSCIEFQSERNCQNFITTLSKAQGFDAIRKDPVSDEVLPESDSESDQTESVPPEAHSGYNCDGDDDNDRSESQDVIYLGEYIPPNITNEQKSLCIELMLPYTFFEPCGESSGEDSSTGSNTCQQDQLKQSESIAEENPIENSDQQAPTSLFKNVTLANKNNESKTFANLFKFNAPTTMKIESDIKNTPLFKFDSSPAAANSDSNKLKSSPSIQVANPFSIFQGKDKPQDSNLKPTFSIFSPTASSPNKSTPTQESTNDKKSVFQFSRFTAENQPNDNPSSKTPSEPKPSATDNQASSNEPNITVTVEDEKLEEPDSTLIFHKRAKAYLFYSETQEWRGRGVGNLKILIPNSMKGQKVAQLILRRRPFWQLSMNCLITADQEFVPVNNNQPGMTSFAVLDHSDGTPTERYFSIRFASAENLDEFKETLKKITS